MDLDELDVAVDSVEGVLMVDYIYPSPHPRSLLLLLSSF
jgi:hypothetical protein